MRNTRRIAAGIAAAGVLGLISMSSAQAATAAVTGTSATPASAQATSIDQAATARLAAAETSVSPDTAIHPDTTVSLAESSTVKCDGATAEAKFNDGVISYGNTSGQVYGDSWGYWLGSKPAKANSITLTDSYGITGIGVGFNMPGGSGWLITGSLSFTHTADSTTSYHHGEYEVTFYGYAASFSQSTEADVDLPGVTCSPDASGTKYF
jgi:hypothetical protein